MAQYLTALAAIAEDWNSVFKMHVSTSHPPIIPAPKDQMSSSLLSWCLYPFWNTDVVRNLKRRT